MLLTTKARFIDRELSWLDFNKRVLELAEDPNTLLLERIRFLAIFSSNLDEFFMVRVANLRTALETNAEIYNPSQLKPKELMKEISERTRALTKRQSDLFHDVLLPELKSNGIEFVNWKDLSDFEKDYLSDIFQTKIFPILTPLAVDPTHPFPYISGLSLNLAVNLKGHKKKEKFFARIKIPPNLPRFISTSPDQNVRFITLEKLIVEHLSELFPGVKIKDHYTFRLTRNQDLDLDDDTQDLLESLEQELHKRRFGPAVRLEVDEEIEPELLKTLAYELEIPEDEVIKYKEPLDLTALYQIADLKIPSLKYPPYKSFIPKPFKDAQEGKRDIFQILKERELGLHHPYDTFSSSVVSFLQRAAQDPKVLAIKQTLYRTSGDSPIVHALIEAAELGKQVVAVVELRARFDELANVRWARKLEDAGVHVVYGLMGFKTHAKLSLVVREEDSNIVRYCHVGTGNYNPKTARVYEDLGILSADQELAEDVTKLFNQLSGFAPDATYKRLLVAPQSLRKGLLERIDREIANHRSNKPSGIRFKLNSLIDEEIIENLYLAANAGVKVEVLVRGICGIDLSQVEDKANLIVRSILGRFLEHSRVYHFKNNEEDEFFIGSADLMNRNLNRRVESLVSIKDKKHRKYLNRILSLAFDDNTSSWHLLEGGKWKRVHKDDAGNPLKDYQEELLNIRKEKML